MSKLRANVPVTVETGSAKTPSANTTPYLIAGMRPRSNRFTAFALAMGVLAVATTRVLWTSWRKRLDRAKKVGKVLRQHEARDTRRSRDTQYPGLQVLLSGIDGTLTPSKKQMQRLRVFDHDKNVWLPQGGPFTYRTWNGRRASTSVQGNVVKQKGRFAWQHHLQTCWPMLNWRGEAIFVCPTIHGTFYITDNVSKARYEDVSVKFMGSANEKRTMTIKQ